MSKTRNIYYPLFVIAVVVCATTAVIRWATRNAGPAGSMPAGPTGRVIKVMSVKKYPAVQSVLGGKVSLNHIGHVSNISNGGAPQVGFRAETLITGPNDITGPGQVLVLESVRSSDAAPVTWQMSIPQVPLKRLTFRVDPMWKLPKPGERVSIAYSLHMVRPANKRVFEFRDFTAKDLPLKQKIGQTTVTVEMIETGKPRYKHGHDEFWSTGNSAAVAVKIQSAEEFRIGRNYSYRLSRDGQQLENSGAAGTALGKLEGEKPNQPYSRTEMEKAISLVSPKTAERTEKQRLAGISPVRPSGARTKTLLSVFRDTNKPGPHRFTFRLWGYVPPDPKDTALVVFEDVQAK